MSPRWGGWGLSVLLYCFLLWSCSALNAHYSVPRKTVPYQNNLRLFREEGIWNYSTMLLREDLGILLLGAREAVYALDVHDISVRKAAVYWQVTKQKQIECTFKGKDAEVECRNYIRTLHTVNDTTLFVCGTNAFSPTCDYMTYSDGQLVLEGRQEEGKGRCPFDPYQGFTSLMVGRDMYSATAINYLGNHLHFRRNGPTAIQTDDRMSWLELPNFVHMDFVAESLDSPDGDDDKVYLFFSEKAMEYDFDSKLTVSRVARVCKGDMGGKWNLQKKWTSFMKARLDCSLPEPSLPSIVQDVFLLKDPDWRKSVFYAVFSLQPGSSEISAVCAYSVLAIGELFNEGKFKMPVSVETSHVKWVMYSGELPVPRPGACINDAATKLGIKSSLDLPEKTLHFIRDRPLMDEAVLPLMGGPLLVKKGAKMTRIVVDNVLALNGETIPVMFIGTENGYVQKAVNYAGEMFLIEEIQLYKEPQPIRALHLSSSKGQLYAGTEFGAVQIPVSNCSRHEWCSDCVLARDPYCFWDLSAECCSPVNSSTSASHTVIQSLTEGDVSRCPQPDSVAVVNVAFLVGNNIQLPCLMDSNLAQILWRSAGGLLHSDSKHYIYSGGLFILNASTSDVGVYTCDSIEQVKGRTHNRTMAAYQLKPYIGSSAGGSTGSEVAVTLLSLLSLSLIVAMSWNLYKGGFGMLVSSCESQNSKESESFVLPIEPVQAWTDTGTWIPEPATTPPQSDSSQEAEVQDERPQFDSSQEAEVQDERPQSDSSQEAEVQDERPQSDSSQEAEVQDERPQSDSSQEAEVQDEIEN